MIRTFQIRIPLSFEESFELIGKSGADIISWRRNNSDPASGYIDWKQSFWSLTGNTMIAARLERLTDSETIATVSVHKPLQIFDPAGICRRVFNKLLAALETNLSSSGKAGYGKIQIV